MLRIGEAATYLGVARSTLRRWDSSGVLKAYRTPGNHRRYPLSSLSSFYTLKKTSSEKKKKIKHILCYARVSGHKQKQKGDLSRQKEKLKEYARQKGDSHPILISDVGSGLNTHRSGLKKMFTSITSGTISSILVTFKDRLTRFGFAYIKRFCDLFGVSIIETTKTNKKHETSVQQTLVEDMMSLIACFSGKLYGMRSAKKRKINAHIRKIDNYIARFIASENEKAFSRTITRCLKDP